MSTCRIYLKPLSQGRIWSTGRHGKRFLTTEGREFKRTVAMLARSHFFDLFGYEGHLYFECRFSGEWHTKKGSISKTAGDLDNFNKLILDGISDGIGINDAQIFKITTEKVLGDGFYFEFRVGKFTPHPYANTLLRS